MSSSEADYAYYERAAVRAAPTAAARSYLDLTRAAFDACASNFTTGALTAAERKCVLNVARKYVATAVRVGNRFAEMQETAAAASAETAAARVRDLRATAAAPLDAPT